MWIVAGLIARWSTNPPQAKASEGMVTVGIMGVVSLSMVWSLFRCLFAIHQFLSDISEKLDRTN